MCNNVRMLSYVQLAFSDQCTVLTIDILMHSYSVWISFVLVEKKMRTLVNNDHTWRDECTYLWLD